MPKWIENALISLGVVILGLVLYTVLLKKPVEKFAAKQGASTPSASSSGW